PARMDATASVHPYSAWDEQWLEGAIEGDRFEVAGGRLAQRKGTDPKVKALGARLVKDHAASLKDAVALARRLGIEVPKTPSPSQEWELHAVNQFSGAQFDRNYAALEVQDHLQDITEARDEVEQGLNA